MSLTSTREAPCSACHLIGVRSAGKRHTYLCDLHVVVDASMGSWIHGIAALRRMRVSVEANQSHGLACVLRMSGVGAVEPAVRRRAARSGLRRWRASTVSALAPSTHSSSLHFEHCCCLNISACFSHGNQTRMPREMAHANKHGSKHCIPACRYHTDPSGTFTKYGAFAIGSGSEGAQTALQEGYRCALQLDPPETEQFSKLLRRMGSPLPYLCVSSNVSSIDVFADCYQLLPTPVHVRMLACFRWLCVAHGSLQLACTQAVLARLTPFSPSVLRTGRI